MTKGFWIVLLGLVVSSASGADFVSARDALARDEYDIALEIAKRATADNPTSAEGWVLLGHALSGKLEDASFFQKASLARKAKEAYERAIKLAPNNVEARVSLFEYFRQAPSIVGGGRYLALEQLDYIRKLDPAAAYPCMIRIAIDDKKMGEAMDQCESLLRLEPHSFRALFWLGSTCAVMHQQLPRAAGALREAVRLTPRNEDPGLDEAYVLLGCVLMSEGEKTAAIQSYREALKINPHNRQAHAGVAGKSGYCGG